MQAPLKARHSEVLTSLVREFIETGEPVGSRTLARERCSALSPASIRNVMADLAEGGFLCQPHTSAGRVPTSKAFQFYASSLVARRIQPASSERLRSEFSDLATVEERVEHSSRVLVELTANVGIAAAIPELARELDQIELVPLDDRRVLMVLVTRDHMVRHRVVALDVAISPSQLTSIRNYVNSNFTGWQLGQARRELLRRMAEERAQYDETMRNLQLLCGKGLLDAGSAPEIHMDGASNLIGLDLHLTRERMRDLLRALEEKQRLIEILDRFLEHAGGELQVHVGLGESHPAMRDLALVGMTVRLASGVTAKIAVLGPMRMRYDRAMAAVLQTCRALEGASF
jgi:heat-inducible transcriptional repressor